MVHVPLMFLSELREFPLAHCLEGGGGVLPFVEIARVA